MTDASIPADPDEAESRRERLRAFARQFRARHAELYEKLARE